MTLPDVVNFIGSISTISMSAAVKQRGFLHAVSSGQLRVKEWQCWIPNEWLTKGRPVIRHPGAIPVRPLCFQRFWGAKIAEGGDDGGRFFWAEENGEKRMVSDACMPWHAWIKAWTNEESHEAERKKDPHEKRERRKEDGRKEGKNQRKK